MGKENNIFQNVKEERAKQKREWKNNRREEGKKREYINKKSEKDKRWQGKRVKANKENKKERGKRNNKYRARKCFTPESYIFLSLQFVHSLIIAATSGLALALYIQISLIKSK